MWVIERKKKQSVRKSNLGLNHHGSKQLHERFLKAENCISSVPLALHSQNKGKNFSTWYRAVEDATLFTVFSSPNKWPKDLLICEPFDLLQVLVFYLSVRTDNLPIQQQAVYLVSFVSDALFQGTRIFLQQHWKNGKIIF